MKEKNQIPYLLINLPLTDPTTPYHSIPYLIGSTSSAGYTNYSCLDSNIECLNYLSEIDRVNHILDYSDKLRKQLEKKNKLTRGEKLLYRYLIKAVGLESESIKNAISVLKDPEKFYDYDNYHQAVLIIKRWMDVLSVKGIPGQFNDFALNLSVANFFNISDILFEPFLDKLMAPFSSFFMGPFTDITKKDWKLIGLSVNYISQLPFAIYVGSLIKSLNPNCILCAGGTEITDDVKYLNDKRKLWDLFSSFDALVIGEGETALIAILDSIYDQKPLPKESPGILVKDDPIIFDDFKLSLHMTYENLSTLPSPIYDIWKWDQYWSPEPVILYSPTRGCYWNRCTFCDYGLNTTSPTSPSRQRPIHQLINEIRNITKIGRTLYLAVDAISPAYLRKFTEALIDNRIDIRWSAELRLERLFQTELAQNMQKAGCVCISFGYESGSQRVLDLIDKGVQISNVPGVLKELSRVNIGAQMMGFIGFPTETFEDAIHTFEFLNENKEYWALSGIGDFMLTPGAIVAKRYRDFGIDKISPYIDDDIVRDLYWIEDGKRRNPGDLRSDSINKIASNLKRVFDDRPFVGGIDSSHTILYFAKYGHKLIPSIKNQQSERVTKRAYYLTKFHDVDEFPDKGDLGEFYENCRLAGKTPSFAQIQNWLSEYTKDDTEMNQEELLEIFSSGSYLSLTPNVLKYERNPAYKLIKELLLHKNGID